MRRVDKTDIGEQACFRAREFVHSIGSTDGPEVVVFHEVA